MKWFWRAMIYFVNTDLSWTSFSFPWLQPTLQQWPEHLILNDSVLRNWDEDLISVQAKGNMTSVSNFISLFV